ncbi:MAG: preprotein translocase subunit YajC [Clostridia bacterium]|nr:preprotein translocase subunit YajC [Clostridia bacterium]
MNLFSLLGADQGNNGGGLFGGSSWVMIVVLVVLMVFMFAASIIPQKKRQKKTQEMMNSITVGTKVKTIGGFVGEVKKVDNNAGTFTLDISASGDGSTMVVIDKSAIYIVLQASKTPAGEPILEEKVAPEIVAMDDVEEDAEAAQKKANKKNKKNGATESKEEGTAASGDSLEKTDNNTLLKD